MNKEEVLNALKDFSEPKAALEQYSTPPSLVLDWIKHTQEDIRDKHVLDLGCGTGILGIAAGLFGAKKITFLDIDADALTVCKENAQVLRIPYDFVHSPLKQVRADVVLTNPPFGTKNRHADKRFVQTACRSAPIVYSMHLAGSEEFIAEVAQETNHILTHAYAYTFRLFNTMKMHTQHEKQIEVVVLRLAQPL